MPAKAPRKPRATAASSSKPPAKRPRTARTTASTTPAPEPSPEATPEPQTYNALQKTIATIFAQAQKTTAGHRKLAINLRTVFDQCWNGTGSIGSTIGVREKDGEKLFAKEFCALLNRVLVVKKSEVVGDRCLRFADLFLRNLYGKEKKDKEREKARKAKQVEKEEKKKQQEAANADSDVEMKDADAMEDEPEEEPADNEEEETFEITPAIRVILRVIQHITPLITSKEKVVRYRTTQFIALILSNTLATFPFDFSKGSKRIFQKVASALAKRLQDKEAMVRVQAAVGLIRLLEMGVSIDEDDDDGEEDGDNNDGVLSALIESMQNDPSSDVRRAILYNLAPDPNTTLPYLLERARDVDAATRRSVYTRLVPSLGDFRHLSIGMREKLIRWGLNDRDDSVRQATKKMFNFRWVEDVGGDLLEVLERLDVTGETIDGGPRDLALKGFWEQRKDVVEQLVFDDEYWENLTPEAAFLVRSYNDYCRNSIAAGVDVDEKMPEVTKLAFFLQQYMNKLVAALRANDTTESEHYEFIVQQLLLIANTMDFGDEIGRRKMFSLLRESLSIVELSETVTHLVVEGLGKLCMGENDFCELMLATIAEIHDIVQDDDDEDGVKDSDSFATAKSGHSDDDGNESEGNTIHVEQNPSSEQPRPHKKRRTSEDPSSIALKRKSKSVTKKIPTQDPDAMEVDEGSPSASDSEAARALLELTVNLKCLHIAQSLLELLPPTPTLPTPLVTMLNSLIVPAVRTHEAPVRERGLRCLGLFTLLDRQLAEDNLPVFAHCFNHGHETLQTEALHIIADILLVHGGSILESEGSKYEQRTLYRMLAKAIKSEDIEESVQSTATEVVCKLMLARIIKDEDLLKVLVIAYFDPATAGNQALRQTLSYFLPVYCHSASENAEMMATIAVAVIHNLLTTRLDADEPDEMVPMSTVISHLVDWTDPRKTVVPNQAARSRAPMKMAEQVVAPSTHTHLAAQILTRILTPSCAKEERKLLVSMLGKCWIPRDADLEVLKEVLELVGEAVEGKVVTDVTGKNVLAKVEATVGTWVAEREAEEGGEVTVIERGGGEEEEEEEEEEGEGDQNEGDGGEGEETVLPEEDEKTPNVTDAEESEIE
ncbi:ARM repeat-containing protein [Ascodesmis nigricans]|uniref:ARM repeat-containing protein n=1 Tax=Ascodesmis nigricans TaxID=341454 RepID=A0A4S2N7D8_9PEZI|nr:ARM repeat-containing protein [Ascodesmis nigricans]